MNNITEAFIDYVYRQDEDLTLNHDSWAECAIGQFAASIGVDSAIMTSCERVPAEITDPKAANGTQSYKHRPDLWREDIAELMKGLNDIIFQETSLYEILSDPGLAEDYDGLSTYGNMQKMLSEHLT